MNIDIGVVVFVLLAATLVFSVVKQLLYVAVLVVVLAFAYYTGILSAIWAFLVPIYESQIVPLLPGAGKVGALIPFLLL